MDELSVIDLSIASSRKMNINIQQGQLNNSHSKVCVPRSGMKRYNNMLPPIIQFITKFLSDTGGLTGKESTQFF